MENLKYIGWVLLLISFLLTFVATNQPLVFGEVRWAESAEAIPLILANGVIVFLGFDLLYFGLEQRDCIIFGGFVGGLGFGILFLAIFSGLSNNFIHLRQHLQHGQALLGGLLALLLHYSH